ncbi:MAG: leucyl aminopeptidase [Acidimicrobiales bacterium]
MPLTFELTRSVPDDAPAVAVGVLTGTEPGDAGGDLAFLGAQGFEAKRGDVRVVPGPGGTARFVVGLGAAERLDTAALRHAAGALARAAKRCPRLVVDLLGSLPDGLAVPKAAQAVVEGLVLGGYQYSAFKSAPTPSALAHVVLVAGGGQRTQAAVDRGLAVAEAVCWARDLGNEPGGSLTPPKLAQRVVKEAERCGFEVTVWDEKAIKAERLGGVLGVNRGSTQGPRFLLLRYEPEKARSTVALVGKGITFDSGGLSLKPSDGMARMKLDMGGAAAVLGAFKALAAVGSKVRVLGFVPLTDNMPGPDATRVGDVLTIRNGKTVEVLNTDAEGRLILADALALASEEQPDAIIDLATLTGACMVALGDRIAGLMGNHRGWVDQVRGAADDAGESVWPLPLPDHFKGRIESDLADLKNITSSRYGGALAAGVFLQEFVADDIPWVHLDIAGPADATEIDGEVVKGGTGFGVRTLVELCNSFAKPKRAEA